MITSRCLSSVLSVIFIAISTACGNINAQKSGQASVSVGDVDQNGKVDSGDLVSVLQSGKCLKDLSATRKEGDLNGDGKCDKNDIKLLLSAMPDSPKPGDANGDGVVDSKDADQVMGAGKYNSSLAATWQQGDFNGDGLFTDSDLKILQANLTLGGTSRIMGDCTGDGIANQSDINKFQTKYETFSSPTATWDDCDFNGDGIVDIMDAGDLMSTGTFDNAGYRVGDANKDGKVDSADVVQVIVAGKMNTGADALWTDGDFNNDKVVDIIDIADLLANLEVKRIAGDANSDGVVNQTDVELIISSGKYESGAKATWGEGDFNFDGIVDILDISAMLSNIQ